MEGSWRVSHKFPIRRELVDSRVGVVVVDLIDGAFMIEP